MVSVVISSASFQSASVSMVLCHIVWITKCKLHFVVSDTSFFIVVFVKFYNFVRILQQLLFLHICAHRSFCIPRTRMSPNSEPESFITVTPSVLCKAQRQVSVAFGAQQKVLRDEWAVHFAWYNFIFNRNQGHTCFLYKRQVSRGIEKGFLFVGDWCCDTFVAPSFFCFLCPFLKFFFLLCCRLGAR